MSRRALRRSIFAAIATLYVISVPWYRDVSDRVEIVWGLPDWVAVALGCYVGVAILNALAWLVSDVPESAAELDDPPA